MQKIFKQKTSLIIIAICASLTLIACGAYFMHKNAQGNNISSNIGVSNSTDAEQPITNETDKILKTMTITEWGLTITLPEIVSDAYYVASTSTRDEQGQPNTVWISLRSLKESGCDASLANQGQPTQVGLIIKVAPDEKDPVSGELVKDKYPNGVLLNDYYYAYSGWKNRNTCALLETLRNIDAAFTAALKTATLKN